MPNLYIDIKKDKEEILTLSPCYFESDIILTLNYKWMTFLYDPRTNDVEDVDDDVHTVDYSSELGEEYILDLNEPPVQHFNLELRHKGKKNNDGDDDVADKVDDADSKTAHALRLGNIKKVKKKIDDQIGKMEIIKGDKID